MQRTMKELKEATKEKKKDAADGHANVQHMVW